MGPENPIVIIVEFADFQCPACRGFTVRSLAAIRRQYPTQVAVVFRNWPLPYHKQSLPAARAAECAGAQGQFEAMHDLFYAEQDSLGRKTFDRFAKEAGVADAAAFRRCNESTLPLASVAVDTLAVRNLLVAGKPLKAGGTPTIIINGLKLGAIPDSAALDTLVREAMRGKGALGGHPVP
jgi:protein-disulfide isomerase